MAGNNRLWNFESSMGEGRDGASQNLDCSAKQVGFFEAASGRFLKPKMDDVSEIPIANEQSPTAEEKQRNGIKL